MKLQFAAREPTTLQFCFRHSRDLFANRKLHFTYLGIDLSITFRLTNCNFSLFIINFMPHFVLCVAFVLSLGKIFYFIPSSEQSIFTSCPPISLFVLRTLCSPMHPTPVCILFRVLTDKSGSARGDTLYSRRRGPLRKGPQIPDRGITIGGSLAAIHGGPLTSRGGTSAFRCRFLR